MCGVGVGKELAVMKSSVPAFEGLLSGASRFKDKSISDSCSTRASASLSSKASVREAE